MKGRWGRNGNQDSKRESARARAARAHAHSLSLLMRSRARTRSLSLLMYDTAGFQERFRERARKALLATYPFRALYVWV